MGIIFLFQRESAIYMVVPEEIKELYKLIDQKSFSQRGDVEFAIIN